MSGGGDPARLDELEELARAVGERIGTICDEVGCGFALLMFDFEPGWSTYLSNAEREDMIKQLRDCADRMEKGLTAEAGTGGRLPS